LQTEIAMNGYLCPKKFRVKYSLGVLGAGQLGRMLIQEAIDLSIDIHCMDSDPHAPCSTLAQTFTLGSITDYESVLNFGRKHKVLTVEIENVNIEALEQLEKEGVQVFPQSRVLKIIRDKGIQKQFYVDHGIPTANFMCIADKSELPTNTTFPFVHKMRVGGYDGKGVRVVKKQTDWEHSFDTPSIVEDLIPFTKEVSVIVARNPSGEIRCFPLVECEFNSEVNLVEFQFSPADVSLEIASKAEEIAKKIIVNLDMVGILAIEFFLTPEGALIVNEMAPRPHNSGHHTIECCYTSQFAQHLRSVLNFPLGATDLRVPGAMLNILGEINHMGEAHYEGMMDVLEMKGVYIHLYGKKQTKPFRKMGHVTIIGEDLAEVKRKAEIVKNSLKCIAI